MKSKISMGLAVCVAISQSLTAQTKIDLRTQAKSVDLSALGPTKPAQTGAALPSACGIGEFFFLTSASAGANLNLCTSANNWTAISASGGSGGGAGGITLKGDGASVGTGNSINLLSTLGTTVTVAAAGSDLDVTYAPDTSVLATRTNVQAGGDTYCATNSSSPTTYVCSSQHPLAAYAEGMRLLWAPDVGCATGTAVTLNVDGNGAGRILQNDGNSDPLPTQCSAGSQVLLSYSASLNAGAGGWRIMTGPGGAAAPVAHMIAYPFDGGGVPLAAGKTVYLPDVPFSCTISGWSMAVDTGTATADIWVGADGTAIPTVVNSITASARPAISTGTRIRSTTLTGWNTTLSAHSSIAFNLKTVSNATQVTVGVECDQ